MIPHCSRLILLLPFSSSSLSILGLRIGCIVNQSSPAVWISCRLYCRPMSNSRFNVIQPRRSRSYSPCLPSYFFSIIYGEGFRIICPKYDNLCLLTASRTWTSLFSPAFFSSLNIFLCPFKSTNSFLICLLRDSAFTSVHCDSYLIIDITILSGWYGTV